MPEIPTARVDGAWYRAFRPRGDDGCWYFSSLPATAGPGGRFDLPNPDGTCYWGEDLEVAFRERIRRAASVDVIPAELLDFVVTRRRITGNPLVDLTHRDATAATGVTADVVAGDDYVASRSLALVWSEAHAGVLYRSRFAMNHDAAALFGASGEHRPPDDGELDRIAATEAAARLGIDVLPTRPPAGSIAIIDEE